MPSRALRKWSTTQRAELDRLETAASDADQALRQQLVDAYLLFLAGHFQHFCRELHAEAADFLVSQMQPSGARSLVNDLILDGRMLERGNAHPAALRGDFARMGMDILHMVARRNPRSSGRQRRLEQLNVWRNAIAHQALPLSGPLAARTAGTARSLPWVRVWCVDCASFARDLDAVVSQYLTNLLGRSPW